MAAKLRAEEQEKEVKAKVEALEKKAAKAKGEAKARIETANRRNKREIQKEQTKPLINGLKRTRKILKTG